MGTFKPYSAYISLEYFYWVAIGNKNGTSYTNLQPFESWAGTPGTETVPTYYASSGIQQTTMWVSSQTMTSPFCNMKNGRFYAGFDSLNDYSVNDYAIPSTTDVSTSQTGAVSLGADKGERFYVVRINNTSASSKTITNLKFVKNINQNDVYAANCLLWAYFFDEPIILGAGQTVDVKFKIVKNFDY